MHHLLPVLGFAPSGAGTRLRPSGAGTCLHTPLVRVLASVFVLVPSQWARRAWLMGKVQVTGKLQGAIVHLKFPIAVFLPIVLSDERTMGRSSTTTLLRHGWAPGQGGVRSAGLATVTRIAGKGRVCHLCPLCPSVAVDFASVNQSRMRLAGKVAFRAG